MMTCTKRPFSKAGAKKALLECSLRHRPETRYYPCPDVHKGYYHLTSSTEPPRKTLRFRHVTGEE